MKELKDYRGVLPYASELFGVYQPLLGWKSRRISDRYHKYRSTIYHALANRVVEAFQPPVKVHLQAGSLEGDTSLPAAPAFKIDNLKPLRFPVDSQSYVAADIDSAVARLVRQEVGAKAPQSWAALVNRDRMTAALKQVEELITNRKLLEKNPDVGDYITKFLEGATNKEDQQAVLQTLFERESKMAGYLTLLAEHNPSSLTEFFFKRPKVDLAKIIQVEDALLNFGADNYSAILSPVGIIHMYREYFFEFDSFLGPPVGHVWLSPGGTVELIEISTRRVFTERSLEMATETVARSESQVTTQDELADAVKEENRSDTKFGFSNVASYSSNAIFSSFQDSATANFSLDNAKTSSRETTHKRMRQQSEKLSSEIKRSFKTTFKTSTEVTDSSSKRYVLQNTTNKLVNYELRRKMRKVGVQVQDIGTQLCWHTFVDDPGRGLGVSKLVHIAKPAELADLPQPDQPEMPKTISQEISINIPFVGVESDDPNKSFTNGTETVKDAPWDVIEHIQSDFPQSVNFNQPQYTLINAVADSQGEDAMVTIRDLHSDEGSSAGTFTVHLSYVNFHDQRNLNIKVTLAWEPSPGLRASLNAEYIKRLDAYTAEKGRRFKETFYNAARERIKLASKIEPRPAEELREEERTVIYRALISQLMRVGTSESKHVISELVRSIFDVDKMLYFVAPEWWAPRQHVSGQQLGEEAPSTGKTTALRSHVGEVVGMLAGSGAAGASESASRGTSIPSENIVDWGGGREIGRDNYYITEDSAPAKLGSSLGWLLQLDGDNLRNAMLNSPWVKAVIPIRPGKEQEAIHWLQQAHVEGGDGLDSQYVASAEDPPELHSSDGRAVTIRKALAFLIEKIQGFNRKVRSVVLPNPADPEGPSNHFAGSLPTEAVFEHGFYPLQGGVRFDGDGTEQAIFSQWMEILPTDQVVALQVEYDPKTLEIKEPAVDE